MDVEPFRLTVKNYRCFTDEKPLSLELGEGFTAFIGPNNSGKSSALKFFYDFRHLWNSFHSNEILNSIQNSPVSIGGVNMHYVARLEITIERQNYGVVKIKWFDQNNTQIVPQTDRGFALVNGVITSGSNVAPLYLAHVINRVAALRQALYVGAFRNAINQGGGQHYDLAVGTGFVS